MNQDLIRNYKKLIHKNRNYKLKNKFKSQKTLNLSNGYKRKKTILKKSFYAFYQALEIIYHYWMPLEKENVC